MRLQPRTFALDQRGPIAATLMVLASSFIALPAPAEPQAAASAYVTESSPIEVTVKFKDPGTVAPIVKAFWKDPAEARTLFDHLKGRWPAMADAVLARVTYSDELVLHFRCDEICTAQRPMAIRKVTAALGALPEIAYAEAEVRVQVQAPGS